MDLADRSAELRARYIAQYARCHTVGHGHRPKATRFYGNDRGLRRVKEIDCVIVEDLT